MSDMVRPIALNPRPSRARKVKPEAAEQFSRPPLARMMQLHAQLQARKFPNCRKLAHELEVSAKTIQRDIEFMRYQLGLPIEYDQLHFGFVYTEPVTSFPSIQVSEGEIVALFVAQKALQQYRGTPFRGAVARGLSQDRPWAERPSHFQLERSRRGDFVSQCRAERGGPGGFRVAQSCRA